MLIIRLCRNKSVIHRCLVQVNFGMGADNPLDKVRFFQNFRDTESFAIDSEAQNSMMPQHYQACSLLCIRCLLSHRVALARTLASVPAALSHKQYIAGVRMSTCH